MPLTQNMRAEQQQQQKHIPMFPSIYFIWIYIYILSFSYTVHALCACVLLCVLVLGSVVGVCGFFFVITILLGKITRTRACKCSERLALRSRDHSAPAVGLSGWPFDDGFLVLRQSFRPATASLPVLYTKCLRIHI